VNAYLDSSAILRIVLKQLDHQKGWADYKLRVASQWSEVECLRALGRMQMAGEFSEPEIQAYREDLYKFLDSLELVQPNRSILKRASEIFPMTAGTLAAVHIATVHAWQDENAQNLVLITHDKALGRAARSSGLKAEGF
jgi:predicted nucleic acid-binding protein